VIGIPGNVRVYLACGVTDMRKGFEGLAARVQTTLRLRWVYDRRDIVTQAGRMSLLLNDCGSKLTIDAGCR
jgi:transposase